MKNIFTVTIGEIISIHEILIEEFGGSNGIRDLGLLESSINRIYQTFEGQELFPSPAEKRPQFLKVLLKTILLLTQIKELHTSCLEVSF